jgi:hypothetical protein
MMTPTNKLRFVERDMYMGMHDVKVMQILQQWWSVGLAEIANNPERANDGEWRDVPVEQE